MPAKRKRINRFGQFPDSTNLTRLNPYESYSFYKKLIKYLFQSFSFVCVIDYNTYTDKTKKEKEDYMFTGKKLIEDLGIKNIINYLRKSRQDEEREKKTGEDTLHEQKQLMDRVLSSYGIPYDQRTEIGSGDKIETRPVFQQIIKELREGKFDAIAVKEISRMGRGSYADMGIIYDLITEKNIFIITPYRIYDPRNPSDLRQIRFELFMSREEFETTRERLTGGRYNAAMEGKWVAGKAPWGFNYNPETKRLEINEEEAKTIRKIFDFYANGIIVNGKRKLVQFRALATYLKRMGIKTPTGKTDWHPVRLRGFLENDRYIGTIRFRQYKTVNGKKIPLPKEEHIVVPNAHDPIIDMETWNKVQERLNNRERVPHNKLDFEVCELASLCVCKKCGGRMVRQYSVQHYKKQDGTKSIYHKEFLWCTRQGCSSVKYRDVEDDIIATLGILSEMDNELLQKQVEVMTVEQEKNETSYIDFAKEIKAKKAELERRLDFIFEKHETRIYSDEEFLKRKAAIEKELEDLEKIDFGNPEEEKTEVEPEKVKVKFKTVLEAYKAAEHKSDKNKILREVFDRVEIEVIERGRGRKSAVFEITPYLKSSFLSPKGS